MHIGFGFKRKLYWLSPGFILESRGSSARLSAFVLRGQNKGTKQKAALAPLDSCASRFSTSTAEGASCPSAADLPPCKSPFGLFRRKTAMLGALQGKGALSGFLVPMVSVGMHTSFGFKRRVCWLSLGRGLVL